MTDAKTPRADVPGMAETKLAGARPYRSPELIEYGSIAKLTQGSLSVGGDGPAGGFKMAMTGGGGGGPPMM